MMPIILIITGIILCFVCAILLLRFSSQVEEKISEINALFSSDVFLMHKELREELDELNFSYYEILERQDERISSLESVISVKASEPQHPNLSSRASNTVISTGVEPQQPHLSSRAEPKAESRDLTPASETPNPEPQDPNPINQKVLEMLEAGASKEEIASKLDIGVGVVDMLCEMYAK